MSDQGVSPLTKKGVPAWSTRNRPDGATFRGNTTSPLAGGGVGDGEGSVTSEPPDPQAAAQMIVAATAARPTTPSPPMCRFLPGSIAPADHS